MAFANIWQWLKTAASNTSLNGIALGENVMLPSGVNNAFREFMSQIATVESKGTDVASATTLALGTERYYHVTGTTTITDIDFTDAVDGRWAWLIFDGALTLTHNATTLKLPGGANITTAAGDRALFVQDATDNVICLSYVPAAPVVNTLNGQYKFPATQSASSDANTLDDYEEVSTTVTLAFATPGTSSFSSATNALTYTKIGNMIAFQIQVSTTPTIGTGSGALNITVPWTAATSGSFSVADLSSTWTWPASRTMIAGIQAGGATVINLVGYGSAQSGSSLGASNMTGGSGHNFRINGVVFV